MNERLKQLAAKAYLSVNPGPDPYNEAEAAWLGFGPFERKFAELIVKECLHVLKLAYSEGNEDAYSYDDALDHAEYNIKQHFGVEE